MLTYRWTLAETERFINRLISHGWLIEAYHDAGTILIAALVKDKRAVFAHNWEGQTDITFYSQ